MEHISLDGVIQHEDGEGFAHGGWTTPYRTPAGLEAVVEAQGSIFDLLLGRWLRMAAGPSGSRPPST